MTDQDATTNLEQTNAPAAEAPSAGPVGSEPSPEEAGWVIGPEAVKNHKQEPAAVGPAIGPDGEVAAEAPKQA